MSEFRHITEDATDYFYFNTVAFADGAPETLAGTPAIHARVDGSDTEITTGITLAADNDSKTGLNKVTVDFSASASYAAGSVVSFFIDAGTVDSVSVVALQVGPTYKINASGNLSTLITRGLLALPAAAADAAGGLVISDAGGFDIDNRAPSATSITNLNTVFATDFANNYSATIDKWNVNVSHYGGTNGTFFGGRPEVNTTALAGTAYLSADFSTTMKNSIRDAILDDATRFSGADIASILSAQGTAQADLDILTGSDGVTLATSQPNYAPAVVSDIPTAEEIVNEWEAQSQADPTGFHVNLLEWKGTTPGNVDGSGRVQCAVAAFQTGVITSFAYHPNAITAIQSGLATSSAVTDVYTDTQRVDGLIEDDGSGNDRFTDKALEEAPSGGGGGGDATEAKQDEILAAIGGLTPGTPVDITTEAINITSDND